ncbi:hypothetical protein QQ045_019205 [Rhodiola kirilowii]
MRRYYFRFATNLVFALLNIINLRPLCYGFVTTPASHFESQHSCGKILALCDNFTTSMRQMFFPFCDANKCEKTVALCDNLLMDMRRIFFPFWDANKREKTVALCDNFFTDMRRIFFPFCDANKFDKTMALCDNFLTDMRQIFFPFCDANKREKTPPKSHVPISSNSVKSLIALAAATASLTFAPPLDAAEIAKAALFDFNLTADATDHDGGVSVLDVRVGQAVQGLSWFPESSNGLSKELEKWRCIFVSFTSMYHNQQLLGVYEGEFQVFSNGDVYEGEFHNGKCSGSGVYYYSMSGKYEGDWIDDKYDGHGVETWARGSRYRGQYRQGLRHGIGVYRFYSGDVYAGEWSSGQSHGCGAAYTCADGSKYVGEFKWGMKHGGRAVFEREDKAYEAVVTLTENASSHAVAGSRRG